MKFDKHSSKIEIVSPVTYENPFAVIYKPQGIPSAPLKEDDRNCALFQAAEIFPELLNVKGKKEIEAGLIHRIDTATDGLLLIAADQKSYDYFITLQAQDKFIKTYSAECTYIPELFKLKPGYPENHEEEKIKKLNHDMSLKISVTSFFRAFGQGRKEVRPVSQDSGMAASKKSGEKIYTTDISVKRKENGYFCHCSITNGYRHQVRSHLAWCKIPVKGDALYNPNTNEGDEFFFTASGLSFSHPLTKSCVEYKLDL